MHTHTHTRTLKSVLQQKGKLLPAYLRCGGLVVEFCEGLKGFVRKLVFFLISSRNVKDGKRGEGGNTQIWQLNVEKSVNPSPNLWVKHENDRNKTRTLLRHLIHCEMFPFFGVFLYVGLLFLFYFSPNTACDSILRRMGHTIMVQKNKIK